MEQPIPEQQELHTSEELKSNRFTSTVAMLFVTLVLLGLFIKIMFF